MAHMKNRDSNRRRREDRQVQAKVRQEAYDKLTLAEKIARLPATGANKERTKLAKLAEVEVSKALENMMDAIADVLTDPATKPPKEKKGTKARRQAKKDKKAQ